MISPVTLVGNALNLLGADRISSFDDDSTEAEITKNLFQTTYQAQLTETRWKFATRTVALNRLYDTPDPSTGFKYQFALPNDYLQVVKADTIDYKIYQNMFMTNAKEVHMDYTFEPDVDQLPPYFVKALEYNLASQFAIPITADRTKLNDFSSMYDLQLKKAKFTDASNNPTVAIPNSPYISVRG